MSTDPANHMLDEPAIATPETLGEVLTAHGVNLEADSRLHYRVRPRPASGIGELLLAGLGPSQAVAVVLAGTTSLHLLAIAMVLGALSTVAIVALLRRSEGRSAIGEIGVSLVCCALAALAYGCTPEVQLAGLRLPALVAGACAVLAAAFVTAALLVSDERRAAAARAVAPAIAVAGTFAAL